MFKRKIQYSGPVFGREEIKAAKRCLDGRWHGVSNLTQEAERTLARLVGRSRCVMVNSGSSANLLGIAALCHLGRLKRGDKIITSACTFPTTLNPLIQYGLKPVLADIDVDTLNINLSDAASKVTDNTRAILVLHNLGNPCDMDAVCSLAERHDLIVIEDNCDALGSAWQGRPTGSFGLYGTSSFYAAHHISCIEGGALYTDDADLARTVRSLRDWGRACAYYCDTCHISTHPNEGCIQRKNGVTSSDLPEDYDNKYIYVTLGFNMKPIELQSAILLEQLKKMDGFALIRKRNFDRLYAFLNDRRSPWHEWFVSPRSRSSKAEPSWFAYPIILSEKAPFSRQELVSRLAGMGIETRLLFSGNLARHPAYRGLLDPSGLPNCDYAMREALFIGVYPGIGPADLGRIISSLTKFLREKVRSAGVYVPHEERAHIVHSTPEC